MLQGVTQLRITHISSKANFIIEGISKTRIKAKKSHLLKASIPLPGLKALLALKLGLIEKSNGNIMDNGAYYLLAKIFVNVKYGSKQLKMLFRLRTQT